MLDDQSARAPDDRFLEVRGLRLHLRSWPSDKPDAPPALLLHGWLDNCGSFEGLAPLLASAGPVHALDFRGHGDSSWVGAGAFYHAVEYLADVEGVLDQLGFAGPVRLVGHSLGGAIALLYSSVRPERVLHASLLDAMPLTVGVDEVPARLAAYLDDLRGPRRRRLVGSVEEAAERLRKNNSSLGLAASLTLARGGVGPDPAQEGALAWKWDPLLRAHSPLPLTEPVLQALLEQVATEVLVVRAEHGFLADGPGVAERLAKVRRLRMELLAGATHHLHLEQPAEVAALVLREWARLSLPAPKA